MLVITTIASSAGHAKTIKDNVILKPDDGLHSEGSLKELS